MRNWRVVKRHYADTVKISQFNLTLTYYTYAKTNIGDYFLCTVIFWSKQYSCSLICKALKITYKFNLENSVKSLHGKKIATRDFPS